MGKAEEAVAKRRNKAARKRERRVAGNFNALIAAKRRRKAGTRRKCEGMCYSLPTPEDPFNDRCSGRRRKKRTNDDDEVRDEQWSVKEDRRTDKQASESEDLSERSMSSESSSSSEDDDIPSISKIAKSTDAAYELVCEDASKPKKHYLDFWEACQEGLDVIGYIPAAAYVAAAVNHIARQQSKAGRPMALFLVASQLEASSVRNLCKPLKEMVGLQTISIHPGADIEYQIEGLKTSSFQMLVATPERLCKLLERKAISLSDVSFLVADNLDHMIQKGFKDNLLSIKTHTRPTTQFVILSEKFNEAAISITREFVEGPAIRLPDTSLKSKAACISQEVSVVVNEKMKLPKVASVIEQHLQDGDLPPTLILVNKIEDAVLIKTKLENNAAAVGLLHKTSSVASICESFRDGSTKVLLAQEGMLKYIDLARVKIVINYDSPSCIETYRELLSGMARISVRGFVYTLCGCSSAPISRQLVQVLNECSQPVPTALQMLADAASVVMKS